MPASILNFRDLPTAVSDRLEAIVARFEQAWRQGGPPVLDDYLQVEPAERLALLIELVHTDLECRLKAGEAVRVETYLARYPELAEHSGVAVALIVREMELRQRSEPGLGIDEFLVRFPAYRVELAAGLISPATQTPLTSLPAGEPASDAEVPLLAPVQGPGEIGRLGPYRVLRMLGAGGMGVVFQAEDAHLGRFVALKVMKPSLAASPEARRRFQAEARAMAAVQHDHIVPIYHVGEEHGAPYLAMPLLRGESLHMRLSREGKLPPMEAVRIAREVALGVLAAHGRNLIHRDIKPANIWLEDRDADEIPEGAAVESTALAPSSRVKLLDFGLARATDAEGEQTQTGAFLGTPAYMAPEQAAGKMRDIGPSTDVWAVGVVLYRCLTGVLPFHGANTLETLEHIKTGEVRPVREHCAETPLEVEALCLDCLRKSPQERPTMSQVAARLSGLDDGQSKPHRAAPRRRRLLVAMLLLLGGLIGMGALALIRIQSEQGDYVIETDDPDFSFRVSKGAVTLHDDKTKRKYALKVVRQKQAAGEHELEVADADAALSFKTRTFTIRRGEKVALKAWFERKQGVTTNGTSAEDAWVKEVAAMPAKQQVEAVVAKLKERNPGFDGKLTHKIFRGEVTELDLLTDNVTDLSPVRALTGLRKLRCLGSGPQRGRLADLTPLKDMKLTFLHCMDTKVSDLTPLKEMKLTFLNCQGTKVSDLTPLKGMMLTSLNCSYTKVSDLTPLKDMKLTFLGCDNTQVSDLSPLKDMKLTELRCSGTKVSDLMPLKDMMLTSLWCYGTPVSDLKPLKDMKLTSLHCVNTKISDLSPLKDMKLTYLYCDGTQVSDLSPLKDMKLTRLTCIGTQASDLSPLKDMKLTILQCGGTRVTDLSALKDMKLTRLECDSTKVADLSPLKTMKLTELRCDITQVSDLSPLKDMKLTKLCCDRTKVTDLSVLRGMPLTELRCDFKPERDAEILRSIKTLETINEKPVKLFWQEVEAGKRAKKP